MNKKVLIIVISVVVALAIAITGTVIFLVSKFNGNDGNKGGETSSNNSSLVSDGTNKPSPVPSPESGTITGSSNQQGTISIPTTNSNITTMSVGSVAAQKGANIKIPVMVTSNQGFMGCFFKFKYNTSDLKYTGYSKTPLLTDYQVQESNGTIKFMTVEKGNVTKDGVLIYLEFEVIGNSGKVSPITLKIDKTGIANKQEQYVPVTTVNGQVNIK